MKQFFNLKRLVKLSFHYPYVVCGDSWQAFRHVYEGPPSLPIIDTASVDLDTVGGAPLDLVGVHNRDRQRHSENRATGDRQGPGDDDTRGT